MAQTTLVPLGSSWKYLDNGTDQGIAWRGTTFNDAGWATGNAELGYGDGDEATVVGYGGNASAKYITTYFRKTITITNSGNYNDYTVNVRRDDGLVLYVNGVEVYRSNMPIGTITYTTLAPGAASDDGATIQTAVIPASVMVTGTNVISAEIHQNAANSSDLTFELQLLGNSSMIPYLVTVFPLGSVWKYLDNGTNQGSAWYGTGYNDLSWATGNGEFGYGDGDETTVVSFGGNATAKYPTTYFRKTFSVTALPSYTAYIISLKRDDGIILYLNGSEIYRENMPLTGVNYTTYASSNCADDGGTLWTATLPASVVVSGTNVIAAEIHQTNASSSDLTFDLSFKALTDSLYTPPPTIVKGPYLVVGTPTSMVVRWETNVATNSQVLYGISSTSLSFTATNTVSSTTHTVQISGLSPYTKYYYSIGSTTQTIQGDTNNYFVTNPIPGTPGNYRFWMVGDCGNASTNQINCMNQYLAYNGGRITNAFLLSGDNAYNSGTNAEYNSKFFSIYQNDALKKMTMYSAPGNHDYNNGASTATTVPYFTYFQTPANGESGGVPSNNPAYYSFDYGNVHFLSLDSYGRVGADKMYDTTGAQTLWIKQDLAANNKKWVIAYWHHPPYTMGSHNSDSEGDLVAIHQRFIKILERYGVDMIITGHSHDYERSKLMNGHYGNEASFNATTHNLSNSSGQFDGSPNSCPYTKDSVVNKVGTVYVVSGSAGQLGGQQGAFPHNAMHYSNATNGGTFILDIEDNKLDAKWLCADGVIRDQFTMFKDVKATKIYTVQPGQMQTLSASWPGNYTWGNASTSRTLAVSAISDTTIWVKDPNNCVADTFKLKVFPAVSFSMTTPYCVGTAITFTDLSTNNTTSWTWSVNPSPGVTISSATVKNPAITFNNSGTYTVSLIANNIYGAGTVVTKTITINASPNVLASLSSIAICANQSATLTAGGASTYSWSSGQTTTLISVSPSANTTYTLTGTDLSGCVSTSVKTLVVNALPTVTATSNPSSAVVCSGGTLGLSGAGANTYSWTSAVVNAAAFIPVTNTTYTVTGTNTNGCQNTATISVVVNANPTVSIAGGTAVCAGEALTLTGAGANTYVWNTSSTNTTIIQSPATTTTYSVIGTSAQNCSATAIKIIIVNLLPVISVNSGAVCPGFSFTLNPSGATTYSYSGGSNIVSPLVNTNYSVTGTSSLGCVSSQAAIANVSVVNSLIVSVAGPSSICIGQKANLTASGAGTYTWNTGVTTNTLSSTPLVNTSYTVIGGTGSCTNTAIYFVMVNALPVVSLSGNMLLCAGQTATLIPTGALSYSWSNGTTSTNLVIAPLVGYNYKVTGTDANGCAAKASTSFTVNALPVLTTSTSNTLICAGESATLSVSGASSYLWNTTASAAFIVVSPLVTSNYTVTGTSNQNCSASTSFVQNVSGCTGLEKITGVGKNTLVYPNPNKGTFNIELNTLGNFNADIYNALGERLYSAKLQTGTNNIRLDEKKGIYFFIIVDGKKTIETGKIVIE